MFNDLGYLRLIKIQKIINCKYIKGVLKVMSNYIKNHNFGYGTNAELHFDSKINKLELRNKKDLKEYLNNLLESQFVSVNIIGTSVQVSDYPEVKLIIK